MVNGCTGRRQQVENRKKKIVKGGKVKGTAQRGKAKGGKVKGGAKHIVPRVYEWVVVSWLMEDGTKKSFRAIVVSVARLSKQLSITVKYDDGTSHVHALPATEVVYDFSIERGCLEQVRRWAAEKLVPVTEGALNKMSDLYDRFATADKKAMFPGWRECVTDFWSTFSNSVGKQ
jgi:hypothetical protein